MSEEQRENNPELAEKLRTRSFRLGLDIQGGLNLVMEIDTTKLPPDLAKPPLDESEAIIRNRVDQFGVTEPVIQKIEPMRLIVELPGVRNIETAKELLQETALLEFKLLRSPEELSSVIKALDRVVNETPRLLTEPVKKSIEETSQQEPVQTVETPQIDSTGTEIAQTEVKKEEVKQVVEEKKTVKPEDAKLKGSDIFSPIRQKKLLPNLTQSLSAVVFPVLFRVRGIRSSFMLLIIPESTTLSIHLKQKK
jgi:preprotein translocase subunit SecD